MFKKTLSFLFIALFLYQSIGYIFCYQLQQLSWQLDEWNTILNESKTESASLILSANDNRIQRLNKHEIVFKRRRYDVKEVKNEQGVTQLYCFRDSVEEQLLSKLILALKSTDSKKQYPSPLTELINKNLKKDFRNENSNSILLFSFCSNQLTPSPSFYQILYEQNIPVPPPEIA